MSTPHYDEEYGEPLVQSLAIEFGEDLTAAIMTNSQLTPSLQETVVQRRQQQVHDGLHSATG